MPAAAPAISKVTNRGSCSATGPPGRRRLRETDYRAGSQDGEDLISNFDKTQRGPKKCGHLKHQSVRVLERRDKPLWITRRLRKQAARLAAWRAPES